MVTRRVNTGMTACEAQEATPVSLNALKRARLNILQAQADLTEKYNSFIDILEAADNEEAMNHEATQHEDYAEKVTTALEIIDVKIDELSALLGIELTPHREPPLSSTAQDQYTPGESNQTYNPEQYYNPEQLNFDSNQVEQTGNEQEQQQYAANSNPTPAPYNPQTSVPGAQQTAQLLYMTQDPASKVPVFKGDATEFSEWWRLFNYYVDRQPIDITEKCRILKNSVQGKAARFIQYLPVCDESYELAKQTMQKRYGQSSQAQSAHIQKIHQLCTWKDLEKNDKFIDLLSMLAQHVNALIVLGYTCEALSAALTPVILASIPQNYRMRFNSIWRAQEAQGENKLECLMQFLDEQSILLEECSLQEKFSLINLGSKKNNKFSKDSRDKKNKKSKDESGKNTPPNFSFGANLPKTDQSCIFCQQDHASDKCSKKMSPEERRRCVAAVNGCLR